MEVALVQHQHNLVEIAFTYDEEKRKRRTCEIWVKHWIGRRHYFGLYDQLMVELRKENQQFFKNFLRMKPDIFDELLERINPAINKQFTRCRAPLEPGLKLVVTMRHLAVESSHSAMHYGWRVYNNRPSVR